MEKIIQYTITDSGCYELREAIISQAVKDYIYGLFDLNYLRATIFPSKIERFFTSDYGNLICGGEGDLFLKKTKEIGKIAKDIVYRYDKGFFYTRVPEKEELTEKFSTIYNGIRIVDGCYTLYGVETLLNLISAIKGTNYIDTLAPIESKI